MACRAYRAEVVTAARGSAAVEGPAPSAVLRHPAPQFEVHPSSPLAISTASAPTAAEQRQGGAQLERVVSVLLWELSEARKEKVAHRAQLETYKSEYLNLLRQGAGPRRAGAGGGREVPRPGGGQPFRPPGVALPPRKALPGASSKQRAVSPEPPVAAVPAAERPGMAARQAEALASLQLDNAGLRRQLAALEAQCAQLQAGHARTSPRPAEAPASPGRTTVLVASPRRCGDQACDLALALFEPPPADVLTLQQQLNKVQRDNLKISSKLRAAEAELANRAITAKRWEEACEAQSAQVAALKVDLEQERRHHRQLEERVARSGDECDARDADVSALLMQLHSAEHAAAAAQGEAAALRTQLEQAEGMLAAQQGEAQALRDSLHTTVARLQASELVRHDAEQERDALAAAAERLQQELSAAQQVAGSEALELRSAVATLQQRLDAEEQRCGMQQAQLALVEQQGRETEQMLQAQLQTVQEERNACLAAATRADALLIKLGSHAWSLKAGPGQGGASGGGS